MIVKESLNLLKSKDLSDIEQEANDRYVGIWVREVQEPKLRDYIKVDSVSVRKGRDEIFNEDYDEIFLNVVTVNFAHNEKAITKETMDPQDLEFHYSKTSVDELNKLIGKLENHLTTVKTEFNNEG